MEKNKKEDYVDAIERMGEASEEYLKENTVKFYWSAGIAALLIASLFIVKVEPLNDILTGLSVISYFVSLRYSHKRSRGFAGIGVINGILTIVKKEVFKRELDEMAKEVRKNLKTFKNGSLTAEKPKTAKSRWTKEEDNELLATLKSNKVIADGFRSHAKKHNRTKAACVTRYYQTILKNK